MSPIYRIFPFILQTVIWPCTRLCLWFFGGFKVSGLENLAILKKNKDRAAAGEGGVIFAMNHSSEIDVILLPASLPFLSRFMPMFYTFREKTFYDEGTLFRDFLYSEMFLKLWGGYFVKVGLRDYGKSLEKHIELLGLGKSLLFFPEGGINRTETVGPAKGGVAYLALQCKSPVVPVAVSGVYHFSMKNFFLRRRRITVQFLPPIFPENIVLQHTLTGELDYTRAAQSIMDEIGKALAEVAPKKQITDSVA